MSSRVLPAVPVVIAALADVYDLHRLGFYLLVAAVPAAAVSALWSVGDVVEAAQTRSHETSVRLQALLSALVLVCVLVAAAARGQATDASSLPALSASALVTCLGIFALQGAVALAGSVPAIRYNPSSWRANKMPSEKVG